MTITTTYQEFISDPVDYVDGLLLVFPHGWLNFDPVTQWHDVELWGLCKVSQNGWQPGDRVKLNNRRGTISVNTNNIYVQVAANKITSGKKAGDLREFSLNDDRWQLYVQAQRKRK